MKKRKNSIWAWIAVIVFCIVLIVIIVNRTEIVEVENADPGAVTSEYEQGMP